MKKTETRNYTIVGLRHNDWQGNDMAARMSAAVGKRVVLMHDETNEWNREATAAYIDTEMVGYVANDECHEACAYCNMADAQLIEGRVTAADCENRQLTVTVGVGDGTPAPEDETALYELWQRNYNAVPLMGYTAQERRLLLLRRDLLMLLNGHDGEEQPSATTLANELAVYEQLMAIDVSREAADDRRRIIVLLRQSTDEALREWGKRLDIAVTTLGSPEARERLADYLFRELTATPEFHQLAARHQHTDLEQLEQQLRLFPHGLYDEYRLSKTAFASKLYYGRTPQHPLRFFLSGVLLADHLTGCRSTADSRQQQAVADALQYVGRIAPCTADAWTAAIDTLWQRLTTLYARQFSETHGAKNTTFNRRFTCQLVGTLLAQGVYRHDIPQTEYARQLEGSSKSSLRKDINQGVADDGIRLTVRQLLGSLSE